MRRSFPLLALAFLLLAGPSPSLRADEPAVAAADLPRVVGELVERLDAPRRSERREAEEGLLALGPAALPHLPASDLLPTVSSREAVRRVRLVLERRSAEASVRASAVALDGRRPLRDWLAVVTEQTGNRIDPSSLDAALLDQEVTFELSAMPFWRFVDDELRPLGIGVDTAERHGSLVLRPVEEGEPALRVTYIGAFRVSLASLERRPLFGNDDEDLLRATLELRAEPRLRPLFVKYTGRSFEVTRANGNAAAAFDPEANYEHPLGGRAVAPRIDVRLPKGAEDETVSLAGRLVVTVAAGEELIRFPPLDESPGVARRRGGVTVRTTDVVFEPNDDDANDRSRARVTVAVAYDTGGPAFESHRTWVFHNRAYLEDAAGRVVPFDGAPTTTQQTDGAVAVRYEFADLPGTAGDHRLVYAAPTLVVDVPLAVEWKSLAVTGDVDSPPNDR